MASKFKTHHYQPCRNHRFRFELFTGFNFVGLATPAAFMAPAAIGLWYVRMDRYVVKDALALAWVNR